MSSETSGLYFSGIQLLSAMRMLIVGYCFRLDGEAAFRQSRGPRIDRPNPSTRSRTTAHPRLRSPSERPSSGVGQANPAGPRSGYLPQPARVGGALSEARSSMPIFRVLDGTSRRI
jgi:hypothetical protein